MKVESNSDLTIFTVLAVHSEIMAGYFSAYDYQILKPLQLDLVAK